MRRTVFIFLLLVGIFGAWLLPRENTRAATEFLLTWQADTYVPSAYSGKALPSPGSQILASFEIITDGKLVDLSEKTVYWYVDDKLLSSGKGLQSVSFIAGDANTSKYIRVQVDEYVYGQNIAIASLYVPVVSPEAVIENPFPENKISGTQAEFLARPFFFNTLDPSLLAYSWEANGENAAGDDAPERLVVRLGDNPSPGTPVNVGVTIREQGDEPVTTTDIVRLTTK